MDLGLRGKTVVVVGGSSNLGKACARNAAQEGANVVIASRNSQNINKVVDQLRALDGGGEIIGVAFDATKMDDCKNILVPTVMEKFGRIDSLVMSLGFSQHATFLDTPPENWQMTLDTNITSVLNCVYNVLPIMIEQKSGNMVAMSSVLGRLGCDMEAVYSGTKAYILNLFHSLVLGYSQYGLRFNCVAPALTLSDDKSDYGSDSLWAKAFTDSDITEMVPDFESKTPMGSIAKPDDVGKACLFFISDVMSGHVTGNVIGTDGGMCMGK